jgi:hypothetical protein
VNFNKDFHFTPTSSASYQYQKNFFISSNHTDAHYEFKVVHDIAGYRDKVLLFNEDKGGIPWYGSSCLYYTLIPFMTSWI